MNLIKVIIKLNSCLNISVLIKLQMYYSETKVIMGGMAHIPILIFIVNLIKGKFEALSAKVVEVKAKEQKVNLVEIKAEEPKVKVVEVKEEAE